MDESYAPVCKLSLTEQPVRKALTEQAVRKALILRRNIAAKRRAVRGP